MPEHLFPQGNDISESLVNSASHFTHLGTNADNYLSLMNKGSSLTSFNLFRVDHRNKGNFCMKTVSDFRSLSTIKNKAMDLRQTPRWYAIYTRSRYEKKVSMELEQRGLEHFLPLVPQLRYWKDRKKTVHMPIFPGYLFVNIKLSEKIRVLQANGVVRFIEFNGSPSPIPNAQIEDVRQLLKYPDRVETASYFNCGDPVEITAGPFSGIKGKIIHSRGKQRLLVAIEIIQQAISVEIDSAWLKHSTDSSKRASLYRSAA
ncbi:MAG: UpxY family transcription antiterminator [Caldithrix sp.]|nr:MAG: UpxY family transcription antiterminator [Caldithrix sp.]